MGRGTRFVPLFVVVLSAACTIPGAHWETNSLKTKAASEMDCEVDRLSTYEAGAGQYTVRGCGKRARYLRQHCNRVDRFCYWALEGDVMADGTSQPTGTPSDVTLPKKTP
jgi:hypothetical protein